MISKLVTVVASIERHRKLYLESNHESRSGSSDGDTKRFHRSIRSSYPRLLRLILLDLLADYLHIRRLDAFGCPSHDDSSLKALISAVEKFAIRSITPQNSRSKW
jgi:hypothetical protein